MNKNPRDRIEAAFTFWGHLLYRHAYVAILGVLVVVAGLGTQLPKFRFDTSMESFLHEDDPARRVYDRFREQYGRDERILVAIRPDGDLFRFEFLEKLRAFHADIESDVPLLVDIQSLVNARSTRGDADELIVEDLMEEWPEDAAALAALRGRVFANPLYLDLLVSRDGALTTVVLETEAYSQIGLEEDALAGFDDEETGSNGERAWLTGDENSTIVESLKRVVERYDGPDFHIYVAGTPMMMEEMQLSMRRDMARFTLAAVLAIAAFLGFLFRRAAGVVLPLVTVILSVMCTVSIMAATDTPLMLPTQILPSFLLAVGVGNSVHILVIFYQRRRAGASKEDAIAGAMGHSALAVVMTSLTTAGGLLSFSVAELAPISDFGIFGPVGVIASLLFTIVMLPALVSIFPMRSAQLRSEPETPLSQRLLMRTGVFATRHAMPITLGTFGILIVALAGASRIGFSHDPLKWFPEDHAFRVANDKLNEELRGTMFLELMVDSGRENGLHEPDTLNRMEELQRAALEMRHRNLFIGKTISLTDVTKEIHQALHENQSGYYAIPQDRLLVAQELLLFENAGSDDLEDLVDSQFRQGRITLKAPFTDAINYGPYLAQMEVRFEEILGEEIKLTITGLMSIMTRTMGAVMNTMAKSYLVALMVITPLMVLLIGRVRIGLVSMLPNLTPIIIVLGFMGWAGIGLDAFTMMVGSIAIGLAVDDTIHFLHNFRRFFERSADVEGAVRETMRTTGQAMLFTTLVLSTGFFLYTFSEMNNLLAFGLLTGSTIILAFLADVILAPALMALVARPRRVPEAGSTMEATR